jgi:hypothetical protein
MIHYALRCDDDHAFDGWFASSDAFDRQQKAGLLCCPVCGSPEVDRALMAPAVATRRGRERDDATRKTTPPGDATPEPPSPAQPETPPPGANVMLRDHHAAELRAALKTLREAVEKHGVNVGRAFPEEARRIHYGEAEPRGIYGQADLEEARELIEEGISILPLPVLPDERN